MLEFFSENFQGFLWLAVVIIAMIPTLEGRIALPFALSLSLNNPEITPFIGFVCTFLGSILPSLPILFLCKFLKKKSTGFLHDKFINIINLKYLKNSQKISNKSKIKSMILLCLFVALPLPMTGVWSGSLIAGFSNLTIFESFISITFGSLICCFIMLAVSLFFGNSILYLLVAAIIIILAYSLTQIVLILIKKHKNHG